VPAAVAGPAGGTVYRGEGYVHSGLLTPGGVFALTIDAPAGTYAYACLLHYASLGHAGTLTVTE
jgi:hypothetical protein